MGFAKIRKIGKNFGGKVTLFGKKLSKLGQQTLGGIAQGADLTSAYGQKAAALAQGVANVGANVRDVAQARNVESALEKSKGVYKAGAGIAPVINRGPVTNQPTHMGMAIVGPPTAEIAA